MSKNNKILLAKYLPLSIAVVLLVLIFLPEKAHAEPVYQVLKDNTGIGKSIKNIWKNVKDLVNYLVVAVLIAVAFAQILHVNINTYGIKKVLPALVLAVIGANLSFFVCRILVDLGNVVLTLMLNPTTSIVSSSTTPGTTLADAFRPLKREEFQNLAKPENWSPTILFIKSLMMLVGAIMLYILAFLLFIRNWMIYFLIVLGPLAFMATILPQTKALFTQWWNQFLKWTFMPLVSIFWLWLGAKWSNTAIVAGISDTGEGLTSGWFMKSVFAMVCFYLAIATPMKMGGPIMQQWAGLGKKAWKGTGGKVGDYWGLRARNFGMRRVNEYKQYGLNLQRMGKNPISRFAGKHWLGTGMDKAQADRAHEEARAKGITEGLQARHYYRQGEKLQRERKYIETRQGEIGEFEKYMKLDIYAAGERMMLTNGPKKPALGAGIAEIAQYRKDKRLWDAYQYMTRLEAKSSVAKTKMESADSMEAASKNWMTEAVIRGNFPTPEYITNQELGLKESDMTDEALGIDPSLSGDQKKAAREKAINASKDKKFKETSRTSLLAIADMTPEEHSEFRQLYGQRMQNKEVSDLASKKATGDLLREILLEKNNVGNITELQATTKDLDNVLRRAGKKLSTIFEKQILNPTGLTDFERKQLAAEEKLFNEYKSARSKFVVTGSRMGVVEKEDDMSTDWDGIKGSSDKLVTDEILQLNKKLTTEDGALNVPMHLQPQLIIKDGKVEGFVATPRIVKTRIKKKLGEMLKAGVQGNIDEFSVDEMNNTLLMGDPTEGISQDDLKKYYMGGIGNSSRNERKIIEFVAGRRGLMRSVNDPRARVAAFGELESLAEYNPKALQKVTRKIQDMMPASDLTKFQSNITDKDITNSTTTAGAKALLQKLQLSYKDIQAGGQRQYLSAITESLPRLPDQTKTY